MYQGKFIFAQLVEFVYRHDFDKCVVRYNGDSKVRQLTCRDQFLAMMFGQLTNLKSLSGIIACLNAHCNKLYHLGFKTKKFVLSTLTRANENRSWKIYRDLAQLLIKRARKLYVDDNDFDIDLKGTPYVLDSTIIELCFSIFKWAKFRKQNAAIKIHAQLDLRGNIPSFFLIKEAKIHDVNILDELDFEENAYYIMDRGYFDYARLYQIHTSSAFFIIRARITLSFTRIYSRSVDKTTGVRCDQIMKLNGFYPRNNYPEKLRRIKYYDEQTDKYYVFLTNNFELDAKTITELYKHRWQIELFFKWIKQHLHIEIFWGRSFNSIKTQICIAICTFLLVAIAKKQLNVKQDLYKILQILSVSQFDKTPINTLLSEVELQKIIDQPQKQQCLWDI